MNVKTNTTNPGTIVSVRGSVVDIRFDGHLPPIYSVLRAGVEQKIVIEPLETRVIEEDQLAPVATSDVFSLLISSQ